MYNSTAEYEQDNVYICDMSEIVNSCPAGCPGCYYPKCSYDEVIDDKSLKTSLIFSKIGLGISDFEIAPEATRLNYRRKSVLHTTFSEGRWKFGLIKNDEVIDIEYCAIHSEIINRTVKILKRHLPVGNEFPLRYYVHSGRQAALVFKTRSLANQSWLDNNLKKELADAGTEGLWIHCNESAGKRIFLKDKLDLLWGNEFSADENGLAYGPLSFTQQIKHLSEKVLDLSLYFFSEDKISDTIIDLYSGSGSGLKKFSGAGFRCMGVELSGEAVKMSAMNNPGIVTLRGKCHQRIPQAEEFLANELITGKWNLYVNPPRTGLDKVLIQWICKTKPERIAYLSCSPHTLARDLSLFIENNYKVNLLKPFDFFPYTRHVETLALLCHT